MATLYLIGTTAGATTASWNTLAHWRTDNGGVPSGSAPAALPNANDDVIIYKASGNFSVTIPAAGGGAVCRDITFGGSSGVVGLTMAGTSGILTVSGNMNLSAALSVAWTSNGSLRFNGQGSSYNINPDLNANLIAAAVVFNGSATTTFNLTGNLRVSNASGVSLTQGNLNLGTTTLTSTLFESSGAGTRTLTFGASSSMSLTGVSPWNVSTSGLSIVGTPTVNLTHSTSGSRSIVVSTLNASTPTNYPIFIFSGISSGTLTFSGGGACYVRGTTSPSTITISSNTTVIVASNGFTPTGAIVSISGGTLNLASGVLTASSITGPNSGTITFPSSGTNLILNDQGSVWNFVSGYTINGTPLVSLSYASSGLRTITLAPLNASTPTNYPTFIINSGTGPVTITSSGVTTGTCFVQGTTSGIGPLTIQNNAVVKVNSNGLTFTGGAVTLDGGTLDITGGVLSASILIATTSATSSISFPLSFSGTYNLLLSDSGTIWNVTNTNLTFSGIPRVRSSFASSTNIFISNTSNTNIPIFSMSGTGITTVTGFVKLAAGTGSWVGTGSITVGSVGAVANLNIVEGLTMGTLTHTNGVIDLETNGVSISAKEYVTAAANANARTIYFGANSTITLTNSGTSTSASPYYIPDTTSGGSLTFAGAGNPVFEFTNTLAAISIYTADYSASSKYPYFLMDAATSFTFSAFSVGNPTNPSYVGTTTNGSFAGLAIGSGTYTSTNIGLVSSNIGTLNGLTLRDSCFCTGTCFLTAGKLNLTANLTCDTFSSTGSLTRSLISDSNYYIITTGSGAVYAPVSLGLTISDILQIKITYTGASAVSVSPNSVTKQGGALAYPTIIFDQGSSPSNTVTINGPCRLQSDSSTDISNITINNTVGGSTPVYLAGNLYCQTLTVTAGYFYLYDAFNNTFSYNIYAQYFSVVSASSKTIDFGNGQLYVGYHNSGAGTLCDLNSTSGGISILSQLTGSPQPVINVGHQSTNYPSNSYTINGLPSSLADQSPYFIFNRNGTFSLGGGTSFGGLNFTNFTGTLNTSASTIYNYGDLIISNDMTIPNTTSNIIEILPSYYTVNGDVTFTCPKTITFPLSIDVTGSNVTITNNIVCSRSVSIISDKTKLQCNTVTSSGVYMNNISLEPPIAGDTTTITSSSSSNIYLTPWSGTTQSPVQINATFFPQAVYSGFSWANINFTYGPSITLPSVSGSYNNVTGAVHTVTFTGTTYVYGTINVANIIVGGAVTANLYDINTNDITGSGTTRIYGNANCNSIILNDVLFYTGEDTKTLRIRKQDGSLSCSGFYLNFNAPTTNGTLSLLSNITFGNSTNYSTSGSGGDLPTIFNGKLDLNGYTVQGGFFISGGGTLDLKGGILRIHGMQGSVISSASYVVSYYDESTDVTTYCNVLSSSVGGKIQFYGSRNPNNNQYYIINITDNNPNANYSNIDIELHSIAISNTTNIYMAGQTINNIKNMNTIRKVVNFQENAYPYNVKNLELNNCTISGTIYGGTVINYVGQNYINLSNSYISYITTTPQYPPNKFIALTSNQNLNQGNNANIIFEYRFDSKFLQMF
jgi:hypothetical protein